MIIDRFIGFIANVININGEGPNFGKVQIRIVGDQGQSTIQDEDLLWATLAMPVTSASERGIGTTPNWLTVGSTVVGYFLDGNYRNIPMITGVIHQMKKAGPGISPLASGENIPRNYNDFEKELGVEQARHPSYKDNKVITTASKDAPETINHIIELDDTQQAERILIKHKNGSYVEFLPNGTVIVKGTEAFAAVANQVKLRAIVGMLLKSDGDADIISAKDIHISADGNLSIKAKSITLEAETINMSGSVAVVGGMTLNGRPVATT